LPSCIFCGHESSADLNHFHGSQSTVCKSTVERRVNCRSDFQNFKIRVGKYKKSPNQEVKEFAYIVEQKVLIEGEPAINWNRQLMSVRKLMKKLPMIPMVEIQ
jgi:hypothetical protein